MEPMPRRVTTPPEGIVVPAALVDLTRRVFLDVRQVRAGGAAAGLTLYACVTDDAAPDRGVRYGCFVVCREPVEDDAGECRYFDTFPAALAYF